VTYVDWKMKRNEKKYIDKDYMIDYQKFYSRAFELIERTTKRIPFLMNIFLKWNLKKYFSKGNYEQFKKSYLGFVVVKEIFEDTKKEGNKERFFIYEKYHASLFGIPLNVDSLPFQDQDLGVGM